MTAVLLHQRRWEKGSNRNWYLPDGTYYSHAVTFSKETNEWRYWSYLDGTGKGGYNSSRAAMEAVERSLSGTTLAKRS